MKKRVKQFLFIEMICMQLLLCGCDSKSDEIGIINTEIESETEFLPEQTLNEPYKQPVTEEVAGEIFLSSVNDEVIFRLYCSTPAAGLMDKVVYVSHDGGKNYKIIANISSVIKNYPKGMIFFTEDIGYIITGYYHDDSFLYRTEDGGKTWKSQRLKVPSASYSYINGVHIEKESKTNGKLVIEIVSHEEKQQYEYYTQDAGANWVLR